MGRWGGHGDNIGKEGRKKLQKVAGKEFRIKKRYYVTT